MDAFDADTQVTGSEGVFAAELTRRWDGAAGAVNGGYMLAICLRALAPAMPFPDPVVVSGFFLKPGTAGPASVRTSLIRGGRTTAFGESVLALGAGSTTIQLTVHLRARPAPGWLACRVATRFAAGGYHEEDFEIWDSAGTLVAQSRQLAMIVPL